MNDNLSKCPYCHGDITGGQKFVVCPKDRTLHHAECWEANGNHCAIHGCDGVGEQPVNLIGDERDTHAKRRTHAPNINAPKIPFPTIKISSLSIPSDIRQWMLAGLGIICGAVTGGFIANLVYSILLPYIPGFQQIHFVVLAIAGGFGLWKGFRSPMREIPRMLFVAAGWQSLTTIGTLLADLANIEQEVRTLLGSLPPTVSVPNILGLVGALAGGFILEIRPNLLRSGIGSLFGYLVFMYMEMIWFPYLGIGLGYNYLVIRLVTGFSFVFIPFIWAIPLLPFIGALISLSCGFISFSSSGEINLNNPYRITVLAVTLIAAGFSLIRNNDRRLNLARPTIQDILSTLLFGVLAFSIVAFSWTLVMLAGAMLKPVFDYLLSEVLHAPILDLATFKYIGFAAEDIYQIYQNYWIIVLVTYGALYSLLQFSENKFIGLFYWFLRFILLTLSCAIVACVMDQFFENVLGTWAIYNWVGGYILMLQDYLFIAAIIIGVLFATTYFKDKIPFWLTLAGFAIWFFQILLLTGILILIIGLLGIGIGEIYAMLTENAYQDAFGGLKVYDIFGLVGSYIGLALGCGYFFSMWSNHNLGWLSTRIRDGLLSFFKYLDRNFKSILNLNTWWRVALFIVVSALMARFYLGGL